MKIISIVRKGLNAVLLMLLVLVCTGPFLAAPAMAEDAKLADIVVTNTRDHLLLYFTVTDCFTENMKKAMELPSPLSLVIYQLFNRSLLCWLNLIVPV